MVTDKIDSKIPEWLIIATSFFRFYYYTIRKSERKYDIAANVKESVAAMMTPMILILIYPFISGVFLSEGVAAGTAFLLIPLFIFNFMYLSYVSNEGYRLRREGLNEEHEKKMERLKQEDKELEDYIKKLMHEEYARLQREKEYIRDKAQKASADQSKLNAIKLMGLSDSPTIEEAKRAYRRLSKIHHPDAGGTQENFIRLTKAYEYLVKVL